MRLSRHGLREMVLMTLILGVIAWGLGSIHVTLALPIIAVWIAGLAFFRDPHRRIPGDPAVLVSPADGRVTEVTMLDHHPSIGGPATRVGIFLSVLDVHINRSPCDGRVIRTEYQPGEFLDARHAESGQRNECNTIVVGPGHGLPGPIVVRQVAGLIARRIVCSVQREDMVARGQRIGLIKFGSRTELIVPRDERWRVCVQIGDHVRGGSSILLRYAVIRTELKDKHDQDSGRRIAKTAAR